MLDREAYADSHEIPATTGSPDDDTTLQRTRTSKNAVRRVQIEAAHSLSKAQHALLSATHGQLRRAIVEAEKNKDVLSLRERFERLMKIRKMEIKLQE